MARARGVTYHGRCLASVILVLAAAACVAAGTPSLQRSYYAKLLGSTALMVVVHAWGAQQPGRWQIRYHCQPSALCG